MEVYGSDVMSRQHVTAKWVSLFREGRSDVEKFKTVHSVQKVVATVFWESFWLNSCLKATPSMPGRNVQNRRRVMLMSRVECPSLTTTPGPPNTARTSREPLTLFGWEIPRVFICLSKEFLDGKRHSDDDEVKQTAEKWLKGLAGEVCDTGVQNLGRSPDYKKRIELEGDCVEK